MIHIVTANCTIEDGQEWLACETDAWGHHQVHAALGHHGGTAGGVRRHRQEELRQVCLMRECHIHSFSRKMRIHSILSHECE